MNKSKSQLRRIAVQQGKPMLVLITPRDVILATHLLAVNKLILGEPEKKEPEATIYGVIPVNFFFLP